MSSNNKFKHLSRFCLLVMCVGRGGGGGGVRGEREIYQWNMQNFILDSQRKHCVEIKFSVCLKTLWTRCFFSQSIIYKDKHWLTV